MAWSHVRVSMGGEISACRAPLFLLPASLCSPECSSTSGCFSLAGVGRGNEKVVLFGLKSGNVVLDQSHESGNKLRAWEIWGEFLGVVCGAFGVHYRLNKHAEVLTTWYTVVGSISATWIVSWGCFCIPKYIRPNSDQEDSSKGIGLPPSCAIFLTWEGPRDHCLPCWKFYVYQKGTQTFPKCDKLHPLRSFKARKMA